MVKILIADRSVEFCEAISRQLSCSGVQFCHDGEQVLDAVHDFEPDLLILELELPIIDGLSIMRTLRSLGKEIDILAMTACIHSDYIIQNMVQLGVQYLLPKPCTVSAVVSNANEILFSRQNRGCHLEYEVDNLLLTLGFRLRLSGYPCVREALLIMAEDSSLPTTKFVYPKVAQICGGTDKRVERAIRSVITDAWNNRNDSVWRLFFAPGRDGNIPLPTSSYFLTRIAACLENKKAV